jgi:hypothetical protein
MEEFQGKPIYTTVLENRASTPWRVLEHGKLMGIVPTGKSLIIRSIDPVSSYARYSRVERRDKGVDWRVNKHWTPPENWGDAPRTELLNLSDTEVQAIRIGGVLYEAYWGVPRLVPVFDLTSELALVERMTWVVEEKKIPDEDRGSRFLVKVREEKVIKTPRSKGELDRIDALLKKQVLGEVERRRSHPNVPWGR